MLSCLLFFMKNIQEIMMCNYYSPPRNCAIWLVLDPSFYLLHATSDWQNSIGCEARVSQLMCNFVDTGGIKTEFLQTVLRSYCNTYFRLVGLHQMQASYTERRKPKLTLTLVVHQQVWETASKIALWQLRCISFLICGLPRPWERAAALLPIGVLPVLKS